MASRYWVGGSATWDATAGSKWATTSGGAGGAAIPTAADDVFFDGSSGSGTITLSSSSVARSIDCNGFTGTISHPAATTVNIGDATAGAGNRALRLASGMTYTVSNASTSILAFISTSATQQTITSAGKTMPSYTINGAGSSYLLADANTIAAGSTLTVTAGTFDTGNQVCSWGSFSSSNSNTRTITLGSSTIDLTATSGNCWTFTTTTNMTFNANTSVITITGGTQFICGSVTYYHVYGTSDSAITINGNLVATEFRRTNSANSASLILTGNITLSGNITLQGLNTQTGRMYVRSTAFGVNSVITCNGTATLAYVDFTAITGAGSASWSGTSLGNAGGNSGITFATPVTRYFVYSNDQWQNTANWSATSGGATGASAPLPQDQAIFDANSFSSTGQSVSVQSGGGHPANPRICAMNWTGVTNNPTFISGQSYYQTGSVVFVAGMQMSGTFGRVFCPSVSGQMDITMAGQQWAGGATTIDCGSQNVNFLDAFSSLSSITFLSGNWSASGNVTVTGVQMNGTVSRTLNLGSVTWELTGTSPWSGSSLANLTINAGSSTIKLTNNSGSNKNFGFAVPAYTYNRVWVATGGAGITIFIQSGNYTTFKVDAGRHVRFNASTTHTFASAAGFEVVGSAGNQITISSSSTTNHTLSVASGIVSSDYLIISDSDAGGGATWYAGSNSTDNGGANTGWIFASYLPISRSDTLSLSDAATKTVGKPLADSITLSESAVKQLHIQRSDTLSLSDQHAKTAVHVISDIIMLSDNATVVGTTPPSDYEIPLADIISLSDRAKIKRNNRVRWYDPATAAWYV